MSGRIELLRLLADGALHSGEELAAKLSISRAAVWKRLQQFEEWGIAVEARPGSGYQLESPMDLLDAAAIRALLPPAATEKLRVLEVHESLDSTSDRLLAAGDLPPGRFDACLAEFQSAGRGRRGRRWVAPFGSGLCLSVSWSFRESPATLGALSLAAGVAALRALSRLGYSGLALKWPNDIVHAHRKLGGLLLQMRSEASGPAYVVAGLGLNLRMPPSARKSLSRLPDATPVTDLAAACVDGMPARCTVAARVATEMLRGFAGFAESGFESFASDWARFDSLRDAPVTVHRPDGRIQGIARGADAEGALRVERAGGGIDRVHAGDVSLRRVGAST